ncbi:MAG TPA: DUF1127 domain-containing protein [Acetobacteraceae bacterium]
MFDGPLTALIAPLSFPHRRPRRAAGLGGSMHAAWRRWRTRRAIAGLDGLTLKDIGVSYAEAEAEANKPFWVR